MTSTVISRLELNHPDLGTPGGAALHTAIADLYKKIGDNLADRYFPISNLNAAASVDCDHNFNTDLTNIHIDIYGWNEGTGLLTYLDETTTPKLSEIAVIAKVGDTKKQITVTNNSAGQVDLALVVSQEILFLREGDIKDIDIVSTPPEDGQSLVFETSSQKFKPGASGDSSFKFQKLTGSVLTIKKGYMGLSDGSEIYSSVDLTPDLATFIPGANGDYYGYFDRYLFPDFTTVNGRKLLAMTTAQLVFSTTTPDKPAFLSRYVPIGKVQKSAGVFTNIETLAMRKHDIALGVDGSLLDSLEYTLIGAVGDTAQLNSGHQLAASSFPTAAIGSNLSWYNLPDLNDDSGNARTLTNVGTVPFTGNNIFGVADCPSFNGSSQGFSSSNSFFNPGNADFTLGAWVYSSNWLTDQAMFAQWEGSTNYSFILETGSLGWGLQASTDGSSGTFSQKCPHISASGWVHLVIKYESSGNKIKLYVNGVLCIDGSLGAALWTAASPVFKLGHFQSTFWLAGRMDEFFFAKYAMSDNDIMKIQAAKYTHNKGVSSNSQDWRWWIKTATDAERRLDYDPVIAQTLNELFFDLSQEATTALISRKLFNAGQTGLSKPAKGQTLTLTTDQLDAILPITHNCGAVPNLAFMVSDGTDYVAQDVGSIFKQDATQIKIAGDSLVTLFGTGVNVILSYSSGVPSVFVPNKIWNKVVASSAVALSVNDRLHADGATPFTATLPASPNVGDECQLLDSKGTFGATKYVTLDRNGSPLRGGTDPYDCDVPNKLYRIVFVDATYGWDILF